MKLAIVHISDIHFKSSSDVGFRRREKLYNTISFSRSVDEQLMFIVTGDIANSGSISEYKIASDFFSPLLIGFGILSGSNADSIIFIPGNHDCNFHDLGDLRPKLLEKIPSELDSLAIDGQTVETLLQVQRDFFAFTTSMTGMTTPTSEQLYVVRQLQMGDYCVEFRCFNSAWLSRTHEEVGTLGFPATTINAAGIPTDADLVISLIHHPDNWLNPTVAQQFRKVIEKTSDFLFTGHEHSQGGQVVSPFAGGEFVHFEAGPFQPANSGESEFGIAHLDLSSRTWRHEAFKWRDGGYVKVVDGPLTKIADKSNRSTSLQLSEQRIRQLRDPGTGFLHPREQHLTLPDIYIYPDLKTRSISKRLRSSGELPREILSTVVPATLLSADRVVIAGPTDCGKTALAKMLFLEANSKLGRSCLLLCGKSFEGKDPLRAYKKAVDFGIDEDYGKGNRGRYSELTRDKRVLLVDDWDEVKFNRLGRLSILENASLHFGTIVLFVDDIFLIQELSGHHEHRPFSSFQIADIREFGFKLRGQIVRKWHELGNTFDEDEQVVARNVADSTRVIDTVLGRNLLPSYPVNIIALLQTYDAGAGSQNSGLGSYGQVYEALITARLAKASIKSIDIGTKITFLSRVAWFLFSNQQRCINVSEWNELGNGYFTDYAIRVDSQQLIQSLMLAGILVSEDDAYRFAHGYAYCYFVAKYFQENLADLDEHSGRPELFGQLKRLSERVYKQDNASIIIFYVFLTKDRSLIYHVIANARLIFSEFNEFDFDSQVGFVNRIIKPIKQAQLPSTSPQANQQAYDQQRDDNGEQIEPRGDPALTEVIYTASLPFEQKLIIGIRYLTLMGQILRNFPGSLKADTKLELAFESYSLGLRVLSAVFNLANGDSEALTTDISNVLRTKMAFSGSDRELRDRAELIIAEMLREIAFALLKRVSHAVGLKELEATYEEVNLLRDHSLPSRLIQLSIRLDHFQVFPKKDIEKLNVELRNNVFGYQTLRDLVLNHLYLFPTDYSVQQWAGQTLNFTVNTAEVRGSSKKMLG